MHCRGTCNKEPNLGELLEDPIVILLMHRDGVTRGDVEAVVRNVPIQPKSEQDKVKNCACG